MPCLPEPSVVEHDLWRTAPALLQQVRRCHLEACGGRRAKRALFGPTDREETRRFVKEELAAIRASDQQKYNFDFSNMVPLAGAFEWQPVAAGEVSAAYQFSRLQSGLHQHRSARRLDFDAPRPTTPEANRGNASLAEASQAEANLTESSHSEAGQEEASPAGPIRAEASRAEETRPETSSVDQQRSSRPAKTPATSTSTPRDALSKSAPAATRVTSASTRQTTITDFWRSRKRPSAFTPCGDSAAKRPSLPSLATTTSKPPSASTTPPSEGGSA